MIYVQHPAPDLLKVLNERLKKEEQFEKANKLPSVRVMIIKELIEIIKQAVSRNEHSCDASFKI